MASKRIGTHSGKFHCDEALACFMLKQLPEYKDATVTRTRAQDVIDTMDIVVDVGGIYDPSKNRFDHHQREFTDTFSDKHNTRLSSAGLVYKHFGKRVMSSMFPSLGSDETLLDEVYIKVYNKFIEEVDAIDNGINQYEGEAKYARNTSISSRVSWLNPGWNVTGVDENVQFEKAMALTGEYFHHFVEFYASSWLPARDIVAKAFDERLEVHSSGRVLKLSTFCPWKEHLFSIEKKTNIDPILYVLFPNNSSDGWRIQCVPVNNDSFENRLSLPDAWKGKRNEELSTISGVPGGVFVHASGFIGGNASYEGALDMARRSLAGRI